MIVEDPRFTADAIVALGGPSWLTEYRNRAASRLTQVSAATSSVEDWRYSRIDELDLTRYGSIDSDHASERPLGDRAQRFLDGIGTHDARVHVVDGRLVNVFISDDALSRGLSIASAATLADPVASLGELLQTVDEPFGVLNDAFAPEITVIDIPARAYLEHPIVVISELSDNASERLSFARTLIKVGSEAEATVVVFQSSDDASLLHVPAIEIMVEDGAHLRYDSVQDLGAKAWQLGYQLARVGRDATLTSFSASLGGDYSRLYTHAALVGEAAESKLFAAYLGVGSQVQEFRTFQDHVVARTKSELVFKGAVADEARSVYSGMIHMRKGARRSEASQTNRNLVLSEGAHADSVPNLDIDENDVRCSHASAVGPIDPEQRFYLESRGIPPEVAERLILLGFFDDLLSKVNAVGSADYVRRIVEDRLAIATFAGAAS